MEKMELQNKLEIAEKRYAEMEARKEDFLKQYAETGSTLSLELANIETENMNKLALAIMKAKKK